MVDKIEKVIVTEQLVSRSAQSGQREEEQMFDYEVSSGMGLEVEHVPDDEEYDAELLKSAPVTAVTEAGSDYSALDISIDGLKKSMPYTQKTVNGVDVFTFEYTVVQGDNPTSIATRYGIDVKTFMQNNGLKKGDVIKVGQKLKINKIAHKVKSGENLYSISKGYGLSTDILVATNMLETDSIKAGAHLELPGYIYTVQAGDNLTQIAKRNGVSVDNLKKLNKLSSNTIHPGDNLVLLFNNFNYNVDDKDKTVVRDESSGNEETINNSIDKNRPYFQKRIVKGKVVATRKEFPPTNKSDNLPLSGYKIIINAGHGYKPNGSIDEGASSNGQREFLINYDNAMRLKDKLCAQGATVVYIQGYSGLSSKGLDLAGDAIKAEKNVDMVISVHTNSSPNPPDRDRMEIFYHRDASPKFAETVEEVFDSKNKDQNYAQTKNCGYQILIGPKDKGIPALLWEVAFINTPDGRKRLTDPKWCSQQCDYLVEGAINYFEKYSNVYVVKSGDNLSEIANEHGISVSELKKANGLKSNTINIGQRLIIPSK